MTMNGFSAGATQPTRSITVRPADLDGPDNAAVGRLVEAYLTQTESEKAAHLGEGEDAHTHELPERYRDEVDDPRRAYTGSVVSVAEADGSLVGLVVVQQNEAAREIKRLWVDPGARGLRVGSALMDAALTRRDLPIRLTVWDWRDGPVRLYRSRGFDLVESWDDRPRLLCMQLAPRRPADLDE
ncbi:GNAT family N-acetyltransferase [Agreia sp. PsM10]|uniref:GNAT family N-acetyltransferase n=1 Tax=Agreia sp. PsM10 TaxID=3030533 RepID=UPI00263B1851|nr:GNAT family N-acetyltransferase [Agreia sp. PsM10]MDN4640399.1 GNAT family N-acetyltransferase [Agreia sp. PsM10]